MSVHIETVISREKMFHKILILAVFSMTVSGTSLPEWQDLNCEAGHKYLFSEVKHTWYDASDECELYGGWLLSIDNEEEHKCLVRYAHSSSLQTGWYWHDGEILNIHVKLNSARILSCCSVTYIFYLLHLTI